MSKNLKKTLWFALLFFDVFVFEQGIVYTNIPSLILAAILAGIINFAGNESMFGDFERRKKAKILERKKRLEARKQKDSER